MDISFLLRGLVIGFSIAAPVGPIGVLCIRRTLAAGRASGLVSGLGAATADAIYGCVAGFGLTFISSVLIRQQGWLRLIGGGFLCYLGLKTFLARPAEQAALAEGKGLVGFYRLSPMVAYPERWCQRVSGEIQPARVAVGEQNFRPNDHRVWFVCPPEPERMRAQWMRPKVTRDNRRLSL